MDEAALRAVAATVRTAEMDLNGGAGEPYWTVGLSRTVSQNLRKVEYPNN